MKKSEKAKSNPEKDNTCPEDKQVIDESQESENSNNENSRARPAQSRTEAQPESEAQSEPEAQVDEDMASNAAEVEKELEDLKNTYLRLMAEYDNYRKRTAREKESYYTHAKSETLKMFLSVYDNLERAVNNPTSDNAYKKGIELIFQQIKEVLGALGVTEIEAEGMSFNPEKHNAVMHIEDEELEENSVIEVFQTGFEVDGNVIRHAVVKVAN